VKHDFNWKEATPYIDRSRQIEELLRTAHALEMKDRAAAISMYRDACAQIVAFDEAGAIAAAWRGARYPINRLSLLLDKMGHCQEAYDEIRKYEQFHDALGLSREEERSVTARKQRLFKKFNATHETAKQR
jgi:hypothetical protein